jgi:hypothetical protein
MCLQYILIRFTPSIVVPFHLPFLRTISAGFILLFSYINTKYVHHISTHSPFPNAHLASHWYRLSPGKGLVSLLPFIFYWHFILLYLFLIHMYIQCLGHFFLLLPALSLIPPLPPLPPNPSLPLPFIF